MSPEVNSEHDCTGVVPLLNMSKVLNNIFHSKFHQVANSLLDTVILMIVKINSRMPFMVSMARTYPQNNTILPFQTDGKKVA